MSGLPAFFRDQLPDYIKQILDHPDYERNGGLVDGYTHSVEYCHPVRDRNGKPFETVLVFRCGGSEVTPTQGGQVCLFGVRVDIVSVDSVTEDDDGGEGGRTITFYTATVREPAHRST